MRIAFVGFLPPPEAGSQLSSLQFLEGLARLGHRVDVLAPTWSGAPSPDPMTRVHPRLRVSRFVRERIHPELYEPEVSAFLRAQADQVLDGLRYLLASSGHDILLVGHESQSLGVTALAHAHGIPCVIVCRGSSLNAALEGRYPADLAQAIFDELAAADHVVTVAEHFARRLRARGLAHVEAIPSAVDAARFRPGPGDPGLRQGLGLAPDAVIALHVSVLKRVKRPQDVVASAAIASRARADLAWVVIGDGPGRAATEAQAACDGLGARVRFVGAVPPERMPDWYRLADLVLMPSAAEGLARVYLETQASGRVLLASDILAAREVVRPGETGVLHPVGDVEAMAAETLRLAADPALRAAIGAGAREAALARATPPAALARYVALLEAVIGRHRRCAAVRLP